MTGMVLIICLLGYVFSPLELRSPKFEEYVFNVSNGRSKIFRGCLIVYGPGSLNLQELLTSFDLRFDAKTFEALILCYPVAH